MRHCVLVGLMLACTVPDPDDTASDDTASDDTASDDSGDTDPNRATLTVRPTADGAPVVACDVQFDGATVGTCNQPAEVAPETEGPVTVGDADQLTPDGLPIVTHEGHAWVAPAQVVTSPAAGEDLAVSMPLNRFVHTTLTCRVRGGYFHDAECGGNDESVVLDEVEQEVTFSVVDARWLEISVWPASYGSIDLELDGSSLWPRNDGSGHLVSLDPDDVSVSVEDAGDCGGWAEWICPPPS